jgi:hypothetical protein
MNVHRIFQNFSSQEVMADVVYMTWLLLINRWLPASACYGLAAGASSPDIKHLRTKDLQQFIVFFSTS